MHRALTIIVLAVWGVAGLIPMTHTADNATGVFGLCMLFILIAYYRWYCGPCSVRMAWLLIVSGYLLIMVCWLIVNLIWMKTGQFANYAVFAAGDWKPAPVMIGFGLFILFERKTFYSRIINTVAASAFGVYLIHMYPQVITLLWHDWFDIGKYYSSPWAPCIAVGIVLFVYLACTVLDIIRRGIFLCTIDRHRGIWFERLCTKLVARLNQI